MRKESRGIEERNERELHAGNRDRRSSREGGRDEKRVHEYARRI